MTNMKPAVLAMGLVLLPLIAQAGDFEITVQRKKDALSAPTGTTRLKSSQNWTGEVKIEYHAFQPSPDLDARYIVYVKRQHIGQKESDAVEKVKGNFKVPGLKPGSSPIFFTSTIPLYQAHMAPGWIPGGGGKESAQDNIVGVWIRLFKGETQVAEYTNPPGLASKFKWE